MIFEYILLIPALFLLYKSFFIVKQQTSGVVERLGKFQSVRGSGFQLKIPILDAVVGRINLKVQQLDVLQRAHHR